MTNDSPRWPSLIHYHCHVTQFPFPAHRVSGIGVGGLILLRNRIILWGHPALFYCITTVTEWEVRSGELNQLKPLPHEPVPVCIFGQPGIIPWGGFFSSTNYLLYLYDYETTTTHWSSIGRAGVEIEGMWNEEWRVGRSLGIKWVVDLCLVKVNINYKLVAFCFVLGPYFYFS